jgi:hypothetical protein
MFWCEEFGSLLSLLSQSCWPLHTRGIDSLKKSLALLLLLLRRRRRRRRRRLLLLLLPPLLPLLLLRLFLLLLHHLSFPLFQLLKPLSLLPPLKQNRQS